MFSNPQKLVAERQILPISEHFASNSAGIGQRQYAKHTEKFPSREALQAWFADPEDSKIYWTKPGYVPAYKRFIKGHYQEINLLQEKLKKYIEFFETNSTLDTNSESYQQRKEGFFKDLQTYQKLIISKFKKVLQNKQGQMRPILLNGILDTNKISVFSNLVSRYEHNMRSPLSTISNSLQILSMAPHSLRQILPILIRSSRDCFNQVDSLFNALLNPSHQADLKEFNISEYLDGLKKDYTSIAADQNVNLNWIVPKDLDINFKTFTNDPEQIKSQVLDNLISNAIQHLNDNPDLTREINVQIVIDKKDKSANTLKFVISNPSKITDDQFARLKKFEKGFSTKTDKSQSHGVALATTKEFCELALGGEFEIARDPKTNYFTAALSVKDLAKPNTRNLSRAAA